MQFWILLVYFKNSFWYVICDREAFKQLLEEKKSDLQRSLREQKSGQERLLQLEKIELERKAIAYEILKR